MNTNNNNNINNSEPKKLNRRSFLKAMGVGTAGVAASTMVGCTSGNRATPNQRPRGEMTMRYNPHSNEWVSLLGHGHMRLELEYNAEGQAIGIDQNIANDLIDAAIAGGVNMFDTAPGYTRGWSEASLGLALKRHPRDKWLISTKMSNLNGPFDRQSCIEMYQRSRERMQVEVIDYYHLHNVGRSIENFHQRYIDNGILDYLLNEKAEGRIRNLGWSFHGNLETFDYILHYNNIQWDFGMIVLNYLDWFNPAGQSQYLYNEMVKKNVPIKIMSPLQGGRLSRVNAEAFRQMAAINPNASPSEWGLRFAASPAPTEGILNVLSGMRFVEQMAENVTTFSPLVPINERESEMLQRVREIITGGDYVQCTECNYCMPCPYGIDIVGIFGHFNRAVTAGNVVRRSDDPNFARARRRFLIGYDRNVERKRQAASCIECGICNTKCPYRINIPAELRRVNEYVENLRQNREFGLDEG